MNQRFFGSLNVFLASCVLLTVTLGLVLSIPLMFVLMPIARALGVSAVDSVGLEQLASPVVIGAFLAYRWVRRGSLEPELGEPSNPGRYKLGHALLLVFNVIVGLWFMSQLARVGLESVYESFGETGARLYIYSLPVGIVLGMAGAWVLWSSRRPPRGG